MCCVYVATTSKRLYCENKANEYRSGIEVDEEKKTIENGWHDIAFYRVFCCIILCKFMQFFPL